MSHLSAALLLDSEVARVADVACTAPRSGCSDDERAPMTQVIAPRRGVFLVHRGRDVAVADPTTAVLLRAGDEYRVSHPVDGGDRCTSLSIRDDVADEVFRRRPSGAVHLTPRAQLALGVLARALSTADGLEAEEGLMTTLGAISSTDSTHGSSGARRRVRDLRAMLAADPARSWRLGDVARALHVSPFHLARQFRAETGESIGGQLLRLRLAFALDRLADGDEDLARVGLDAGFAHHSHFSARFRRTFGVTPAQARGATARELRTIVTAGPPARP